MPVITVDGVTKEVTVKEYLVHTLGDLLNRFDPEDIKDMEEEQAGGNSNGLRKTETTTEVS
jgi:hypothetical protein